VVIDLVGSGRLAMPLQIIPALGMADSWIDAWRRDSFLASPPATGLLSVND
jgi:hypothetical protein